VEQYARNSKHLPSPFRIASIFQVECYCCGYAVNMNKPGQLYYLKRHVEGVRPDLRVSNHWKNYTRWRQQYQQAGDELPIPDNPTNKRLKGTKQGKESDMVALGEGEVNEGADVAAHEGVPGQSLGGSEFDQGHQHPHMSAQAPHAPFSILNMPPLGVGNFASLQLPSRQSSSSQQRSLEDTLKDNEALAEVVKQQHELHAQQERLKDQGGSRQRSQHAGD